jgi:hypothetical protein
MTSMVWGLVLERGSSMKSGPMAVGSRQEDDMEDMMAPEVMTFTELLDEYLEFKALVSFSGWHKVNYLQKERHAEVVYEINRRVPPVARSIDAAEE